MSCSEAILTDIVFIYCMYLQYLQYLGCIFPIFAVKGCFLILLELFVIQQKYSIFEFMYFLQFIYIYKHENLTID